jgi:hypothetical protein
MPKSVELGRGQSHELCLKLEQAGLNSCLAQEVINSIDNYLATKIVKLIDYEINNPASHFEEVARFEITIPENVSLKCFHEMKDTNHEHYSMLSDEDFIPSTKLIPGEKKMAIFYRLVKRTKGSACLAFARQKGQLPNAQGLAAIYMADRQAFESQCPLWGLDEPKNLPKNKTGEPLVSFVGWQFAYVADKYKLEDTIPAGYMIVVFE